MSELNRLLAMMDVTARSVELRRIDGGSQVAPAAAGCVTVAYVRAGRLNVSFRSRGVRQCRAGAMILAPAGMPWSCRAEQGGETCALVVAQAEMRLSGVDLLDRIGTPMVADLSQSFLVGQCVAELERLHEGIEALGASALADSLMKVCILSVLQDFFSRPGIDLKIIGALADPRLAPVVAAVLERPEEQHSLQSMADLAGLSRPTFVRLFAEAMGQPPAEFVVRTRLYYAAELLRTGRAPIKAVAVNVGFSSRSHFSRAFRDAYGTDPTAYRQQQSGDPPKPQRQDLKRIAAEAARKG